MSMRRVLGPIVSAPLLIIYGIAALAARPAASMGALAVTVAVGLTGALAVDPPVPLHGGAPRLRVLATLALGLGIFMVARWVYATPAVPFGLVALAASAVAAVAEEVFFRKFVYGWLARWGVPLAVGGAAVAFAIVHVPAYGVVALPIDVAAGLLFGWQRWASGGWGVPALTHLAANVLQFLR